MEECESDIDFSVLKIQNQLDMISIVNMGFTSFDLGMLSAAERIGQIALEENEISEIDITPILEKPMNAYLEIAFSIDERTRVIIRAPSEKVDEIIGRPDENVIEQTKYGPTENLYGFQWLKYVIDNYDIEWK